MPVYNEKLTKKITLDDEIEYIYIMHELRTLIK